ncbi:hypothetical protein AB0D27_17840 [Streptomyces sp. NPDC048415]|uniref:hypothetical protein n=1 Tax=Streptomyces sp. NPDC048415 TaxID=3154822 RepID=UPI00341BE78A
MPSRFTWTICSQGASGASSIGPVPGHADVVHHDVQPAPSVDGALHCRMGLSGVGHVGGYRQGAPARDP